MVMVLWSLLLAVGHCCTRMGSFPRIIKNFAREGVPTQSDTSGNRLANLAIDGKDDTWSQTVSYGSNAWWKLTLERSHLIDEIRIWSGERNAYLWGASIYIDGVLVGVFRENIKHPIILSFSNLYVAGSSIKIVGGSYALLLAEVQVYGDEICQDRINIAGLGRATQSDTYKGRVASNAIDGNTNGFITGTQSHTLTERSGQAWWKVTFVKPHLICGVVIYNRMDCCQERLSGFSVYVGETEFGKVQFLDGKGSYSFWKKAKTSDTVTVTGGDSYLHMAEVEVFECPCENIAGDGLATQIDVNKQRVAALAIDGNIDGDSVPFGGSVTHTESKGSGAWWKLTFPESRLISEIIIYNRQNCCSERINDVSIYVEDTLIGIVEYEHGKLAYKFSNIGMMGDTVTVVGGESYLELAEVLIFQESNCRVLGDL